MQHPNEIILPADVLNAPTAEEILRLWRVPGQELRILFNEVQPPEPWGDALAEVVECLLDHMVALTDSEKAELRKAICARFNARMGGG